MVFKATLQKESPKQSLRKFSSESRTQILFKTDVFRNFPIFTEKKLCWSHFLIKLQALWPATLFKRDFNTGVFLWILWNFYEKLSCKKTSGSICRSSLLNEKQCGMFSPKKGRSGHSTRFLRIISRTISTRFYWLTCRNQKLVQSKPLQQSYMFWYQDFDSVDRFLSTTWCLF